MFTVRQWTGREAHALRLACRKTVRGFAQDLGLAVRTVTDWGRHGAAIVPRPDTQAILDTTLSRCTPEEVERFYSLLNDDDASAALLAGRSAVRPLDYDKWSDDLDRAAIAVGRQAFGLASTLIDRWTARSADRDRLDDRGLYLIARASVLRGDIRRDQGALHGPASADQAYNKGLSIFRELDIPRRSAQVELSLSVVQEMSGDLRQAAASYRLLARDTRLDERDQARARLWVGTALSKLNEHDAAVRAITDASRRLDALGEPEDWSVSQQKLALANRGAGRLDAALRQIEIAVSSKIDNSPMQNIRLHTAQAHILVSDPATRDSGLALLEECQTLAVQYGLSHQQRAIASIRGGAAA